MAPGNPNTKVARAGRALVGQGVSALTLSVVLLCAPLMFGGSPALLAAAQGLRMPGLLALAIGAALIGLGLLLRVKSNRQTAATQDFAWPSTTPPRTGQPASQATYAGRQPTSPGVPGEATPTAGARSRSTTWSAKVFEEIEWRRFEAVCEKLFGQAGFEARTRSHGADGGVDIWLHSRHAAGPAAIAQCKHWHGRQVGVKELREFYGVMASHKLKRGTYATTSTFTADAIRFARENGISVLDGNGLLALIARRTPEQQAELLQTAYQGE